MGTQPSDQTDNLLSLTFPQTQVLGRFNLASGVVFSSLVPPSINSFPSIDGSKGGACPSGVATCTVYTATSGSHLIDPVLGVSVYLLKPMDAERNQQLSDMCLVKTNIFNKVSEIFPSRFRCVFRVKLAECLAC
jgi:hypothetical protein